MALLIPSIVGAVHVCLIMNFFHVVVIRGAAGAVVGKELVEVRLGAGGETVQVELSRGDADMEERNREEGGGAPTDKEDEH